MRNVNCKSFSTLKIYWINSSTYWQRMPHSKIFCIGLHSIYIHPIESMEFSCPRTRNREHVTRKTCNYCFPRLRKREAKSILFLFLPVSFIFFRQNLFYSWLFLLFFVWTIPFSSFLIQSIRIFLGFKWMENAQSTFTVMKRTETEKNLIQKKIQFSIENAFGKHSHWRWCVWCWCQIYYFSFSFIFFSLFFVVILKSFKH